MFDARLPADSISLAFLEIYVNIVALPHYLKKLSFTYLGVLLGYSYAAVIPAPANDVHTCKYVT